MQMRVVLTIRLVTLDLAVIQRETFGPRNQKGAQKH